MTSPKLFPFLPRSPSARRSLQTATVLLAVVLLHLLAGAWGGRQIGATANPPQATVTIVALEPPPVPAEPAPEAKAKPAPKPKKPTPRPAPKPHPKLPVPAPSPPPEPAAEAAAEAPPVVTGNQGDWQRPAVGNNEDAGNQEGAGNNDSNAANIQTAAEPATPAPSHAADPPPSVSLKYDVQGLRDGQKVYGSGKIVWRNEDGRYRIEGSASVLFFTLLQFSSDGVLDDFGVSPALYTEKRFRKTATDTRFEHARNTITFSASDNRYPRPGNAQDRASIIWQLATIGRGNPAAFFTGADFTMFVAGVRDAEPWRIIVSGEDDVKASGDDVSAWHLVRMPQPGSYDQKIDIWLAPGQQWYPVKIRYTEDNGDYLEMSLSSRMPP